MANIVEQRGFFWWFNEPDLPADSKETSVPALLTITDEGQIALNVDGSLCRNDEYHDWTKPRTFPALRRVVGQLASPGEYVLLEGLERTDFSFSDESPQQQTFTAELCARRDSPFPDNYSHEGFLELRIEMSGLEGWLQLDSIIAGREYTDDDAVKVQVSYKEHQLSYPAPGGTISIESITTEAAVLFLSSALPTRDVHFQQTYYLTFKPDVLSDLSAIVPLCVWRDTE